MRIFSNHFLSALVVAFFIFIAFGSDDDKSATSDNSSNYRSESVSETSKEPEVDDISPKKKRKKSPIKEGVYEGTMTCTCCGANANKPTGMYQIEVNNISENEVSLYNLAFQQRSIFGKIKKDKIIIDERNSKIDGLTFFGTIDIVGEDVIKINIKWYDTSGPEPEKILNHCEGYFAQL